MLVDTDTWYRNKYKYGESTAIQIGNFQGKLRESHLQQELKVQNLCYWT